ncbi:MAG TPA: peptidase S8, partial [Rhizobiales bacterium]|nr:peptidase S8 [Hyphomicrobiales bacterium]
AQDRATGRNITIAIIDSAIDLQHPELSGSVISAYDAIARGGRRGGMPHGTAIASIIAAHGELTGVAPDARLASVRAFSRSASTGPALSTTRALLKGLDWAYGQKARIFNLSFAGPRDPLFIRALERLGKEGAILIAAAGNEGPRSPRLYPAAANTVIAVTATNNKDELFSAASQGDYVEIASPGVEILVASPGAGFGFLSGTSMAAAHVSALAALILEQNPAISTSRIRKILQTTADDLGKKGPDTRFGAGRVNALAAIRAAGP